MQSAAAKTSRSLSEEVTVFLTAFIFFAILYAVAEGVSSGGGLAALIPMVGWAILTGVCWMRYKYAFLAAAVFSLFGTVAIFLSAPPGSPESPIEYDVIVNFLVLPFALRAYRELRS